MGQQVSTKHNNEYDTKPNKEDIATVKYTFLFSTNTKLSSIFLRVM